MTTARDHLYRLDYLLGNDGLEDAVRYVLAWVAEREATPPAPSTTDDEPGVGVVVIDCGRTGAGTDEVTVKAGEGWYVVGHFPESKYSVRRTADGWDVMSNQDASFS